MSFIRKTSKRTQPTPILPNFPTPLKNKMIEIESTNNVNLVEKKKENKIMNLK